jgi:hypothetical protein
MRGHSSVMCTPTADGMQSSGDQERRDQSFCVAESTSGRMQVRRRQGGASEERLLATEIFMRLADESAKNNLDIG